MGHPKWLLDKIADDVRRTYPEPEYRYFFETFLNLTDRHNQPDIQVLKGSALVCVVEIGYTRPEKLNLYCDQWIKDVRWYDNRGVLRYVGEPGGTFQPRAACCSGRDTWFGAACDVLTCHVLENKLWEYANEFEQSRNVWAVRRFLRDPVIEEHEIAYACTRDELRELLDSPCDVVPGMANAESAGVMTNYQQDDVTQVSL